MKLTRHRGTNSGIALLVALGAAGCGPEDETILDPSIGASGSSTAGDQNVGMAGTGGTMNTGGTSSGGTSTGGTEMNTAGTTAEPGPVPCEVTFISPGGSSVVLGAADDLDGVACGDSFSTRVVVSTTGESVTLTANGSAAGSQDADNYVATFDDVVLSQRGTTNNTLSVTAEMEDGRTCSATYEADLLVDCEGPSCSLTGPTGSGAFLNASDDTSSTEAGLQASFSVSTEANNEGQTIQLFVDGDIGNASSSLADASGAATFADVTLDEGANRRIQASCRDAQGNTTLSAAQIWTVDITACGLTVDQVAGGVDPVAPEHDTDLGTDDIQVTVDGNTTGGDCTLVRSGPCGELGSFGGGAIALDQSWSLTTTLDANANGSVDICAEVQDAAGNVGTAQSSINVRTALPELAITFPGDSASFNFASPTNDTGTSTCEVEFEVDCEPGFDVELLVGSTPIASAACVDGLGETSGFDGHASFAGADIVPITSQASFAAQTITARQTVLSDDDPPVELQLIGTTSVDIHADCVVPTLNFVGGLSCPQQLSLSPVAELGDDEDDGTPGIQKTIVVNHGGDQGTTLEVIRNDVSGGSIDSSSETATLATFNAVDLGDVGEVTLRATTTDVAGNTGTQECVLTIVDVPVVTFTAPDTTVIGTPEGGNCTPTGGGVGVLIDVTGTTDAPDGSDVRVLLGADELATGSISSNAFSFVGVNRICVPDGLDQTLTVEVTEAGKAPGSNDQVFNVDLTAPTNFITLDSATVLDRRGGQVEFTWDAITDDNGEPLASYEMRCATADITDETAWNNATVKNDLDAVVPLETGTETEVAGGFRIVSSPFCMVRGVDVGGHLTPVGGSLQLNANDLLMLETEFAAPPVATASVKPYTIAPLGDVNGDGFADFGVGANNGGAHVYFGNGNGDPVDTTADIIIDNAVGGNIGAVIVGLGDINGDTRDDFAVTARNLNTGNNLAGAVYVFFGRALGNPWPADPVTTPQVVQSTACGNANVCFLGDTTGQRLGFAVAGGDFDGDGTNDIILGARGGNVSDAGRVYIVRGGAPLDSLTTTLARTNISIETDNPDGFIVSSPDTATAFFGNSLAVVGASPGATAVDIVVGAGTSAGTDATDSLTYVKGVAYQDGAGDPLPDGSGLIDFDVTPPLGAVVTTFDTEEVESFSDPLACVGDFNGDGRPDLLSNDSPSLGLYLRQADGSFDTTRANVQAAGVSGFGSAIVGGFHPTLGNLGDLDGDGLGEALVASTETDGDPHAFLFFGVAGLANGNAIAATSAPFTYLKDNGVVAPGFVGDVNGDGHNDFAIIDGNTDGSTAKVILFH